MDYTNTPTIACMALHRTLRSLESKVMDCPECGRPLSFRDTQPFCRNRRCAFNLIYNGAYLREGGIMDFFVEALEAAGFFVLLVVWLIIMMCF